MEILRENINQINNLCKKFHVLRLFAFGSVLTDKFNSASDIDFVVDFDKVDLYEYADNFFDFKYSLEDLLHRKIDLLESKALSNPYFVANVERTKKLIYG